MVSADGANEFFLSVAGNNGLCAARDSFTAVWTAIFVCVKLSSAKRTLNESLDFENTAAAIINCLFEIIYFVDLIVEFAVLVVYMSVKIRFAQLRCQRVSLCLLFLYYGVEVCYLCKVLRFFACRFACVRDFTPEFIKK